jgi:8-oxo-dGTP pyrophosphatase MutT (NUDIX family)
LCYQLSMATIREAATVILLREGTSGFEVFLLRRRRGASFMASAFVFPGGGVDDGESAEVAAFRELFEEAGVLLAKDSNGNFADAELAAELRLRMNSGEPLSVVLSAAGLAWDTSTLHHWAHWITPSVEPKRFSAQFWIAMLPTGQVPSFDNEETVEQRWLSCRDALSMTDELRLPPPQIRTLYELQKCSSISDVLQQAAVRAQTKASILPRALPQPNGLCLLLPWDPSYQTDGHGDVLPMAPIPSWAVGPSRFVLTGEGWSYLDAPVKS